MTRLTVSGIPPEGRSAAFLGGVGSFKVEAEADPLAVRRGASLELRIRLTGPAAWGSTRIPDLSGWSSPDRDVETLGDRFEDQDGPTRTFLYRVRSLRAGPLTLPPVAIAAFDPSSRRYATRATSSLTVEVVEVPRFDPASLAYPLPRSGSSPARWVIWTTVAGVVLTSALTALRIARRRRKARAIDTGKLARKLGDRLIVYDDEVQAARSVVEALTEFLHLAGGRPRGVLTPPEARIGFEPWAGRSDLASMAESLVARCDRARYGFGRGEADALVDDGRRFFERLAGAVQKGVGPGEAVGTA